MRAIGGPGSDETTFRMSYPAVGMSLFGTGLLGLVAFGTAVAAVIAAFKEPAWLALELTLVAAFMAGLARYVGRDLSGKWGLRFVFGPVALAAALPAGRSAIHRLTTEKVIVPYRDIAAIETRLEGYVSLGLAMLQRAYVLRRRDGRMTFLFEERALATNLETTEFACVVAELRARSGAPLIDLGMVEGRGGVLGVWGASAAAWSAPPAPLWRQRRLWGRAAFTGVLAGGVFLVATIANWLGAAR